MSRTSSDLMSESLDQWYGPAQSTRFEDVPVPGKAPGLNPRGDGNSEPCPHCGRPNVPIYVTVCPECGMRIRPGFEIAAMAERSGDPELDALIERFMDENWGYLEDYMIGDIARGNCADVSEFFAGWMRKQGVDAETHDIADDVGDGDPASSFENAGYGDAQRGPDEGWHTTVEIKAPSGTYMVDFTASQYGYAEFPMVQRLDEKQGWQREWTAAAEGDANNWVYLDGQVARGGPHWDLAEDLARKLGADEMDARALGNLVARGHTPEGRDFAMGSAVTRRGNLYPQIWLSTLDRNAVWDAVQGRLRTAGWGLEDFSGDLANPHEGHRVPFYIAGEEPWLGQPGSNHPEDVPAGALIGEIDIGSNPPKVQFYNVGPYDEAARYWTPVLRGMAGQHTAARGFEDWWSGDPGIVEDQGGGTYLDAGLDEEMQRRPWLVTNDGSLHFGEPGDHHADMPATGYNDYDWMKANVRSMGMVDDDGTVWMYQVHKALPQDREMAQREVDDMAGDIHVASSAPVPPAPGESPVPEGYVRLYHYTDADPQRIAQEGLQMGHARGMTYGEPDQIWASARFPQRALEAGKNVVEFAVPVDDSRFDIGKRDAWRDPEEHIQSLYSRGSDVTFRDDIGPGEILAIHEPWHQDYRYAQENDLDPDSPQFSWIADQADRYPDLARGMDEWRRVRR